MRTLQFGLPWGLDSLRMTEVADPEPGPGEVRVRMRAISLNYRDLMLINGPIKRRPGEDGPLTPFSDGCGIVEAVGEGVDRVAVGDRVAPLFFQGWLDGPPTAAKTATALVHPLPGVGRELAVYAQDGVSKVPDFLTDAEVASLPCAGVTAWRSLFHHHHFLPGSTVLLIGTGGVSIIGLQLAVAAGCRVIILSSSDEKLERAKAMGAAHGVNYARHPEWWKEVRALTDRAGVDLVLEVGGTGTLQQSLRSIRVGGHVALVGLLANGGEGFDAGNLLGTQASIQVIGVGSREHFEQMCASIELARVRPVIDRTFRWEAPAEALAWLRDGRHFGKITLEF